MHRRITDTLLNDPVNIQKIMSNLKLLHNNSGLSKKQKDKQIKTILDFYKNPNYKNAEGCACARFVLDNIDKDSPGDLVYKTKFINFTLDLLKLDSPDDEKKRADKEKLKAELHQKLADIYLAMAMQQATDVNAWLKGEYLELAEAYLKQALGILIKIKAPTPLSMHMCYLNIQEELVNTGSRRTASSLNSLRQYCVRENLAACLVDGDNAIDQQKLRYFLKMSGLRPRFDLDDKHLPVKKRRRTDINPSPFFSPPSPENPRQPVTGPTTHRQNTKRRRLHK